MNIFKFDEFVVPKLLTAIYNVVLVVCIGVGLYRLFKGISDALEVGDLGAYLPSILMSLVITVVIPLASRIFTELALILFKIEENTRKKRSS